MQDMTRDEVYTFIMEGTRTGKLATVRDDGRPHVVPVWFVTDGDDLVFMTMNTSVKAKNMLRDTRVTLCVDDENPPYAFAMIEGQARIELGISQAERRKWATVIGGRYMGEDRAEEFGQRNADPEEYVVRLTPTKIVAKKDMAS